MLLLLLLRLFLLSVGCCSPGKQEGIQSEREAEWETEEEAAVFYSSSAIVAQRAADTL